MNAGRPALSTFALRSLAPGVRSRLRAPASREAARLDPAVAQA
jgi:hypothetical protein